MHPAARFLLPPLFTGLITLVGCNGHDQPASKPAPSDNVLNLYFWVDDISPEAITGFERETGIKVVTTYFDTNETLESKVLTGNSGFDVVVPTAPFMQRQIEAGAYLPLDKRQLPNFANLDAANLERVAINDPGNRHGVIYAWGTYGIGYNEQMVASALPGVAVDSWRVLFDPAYAAKLAPCGINIIDAPAGIVRLVLAYLGRNHDSPSSEDLADAERVLLRIRPYVRSVDSSIDTEALVNGDICIDVGYNGATYQARQRAVEAHNGRHLSFAIPREGTLVWFDMLAIPKDAPHPQNAHRFLNYMLDPKVAALNTAFTGIANAVPAASKFESPAFSADPITYPSPQTRERLFVQTKDSPETTRAITRLWQKFKTGQ